MWRWWQGLLLLLLLRVQAAVALPVVSQCGAGQYALKSLGLCCDLCPAGSYVSEHCDRTHATQCSPCMPYTFTAHPNRETSCLPCTPCREDQDVVTTCSPYHDWQCQCRPGTYYCDSVDCVEKCYRCTRCEGPTLRACTSTANAVCAPETGPQPANPNGHGGLVAGLVVLVVTVVVIVALAFYFRGVQAIQWVLSVLKRRSEEPGCCSGRNSQPNETLPPSGPPAVGVGSPLLEEVSASGSEGAAHPGPSEGHEEGIELQVLVARGSDPAPERGPPVPAACGSQGLAETAASFRRLEQEYERKYFLRHTCDATNRLYYEFGQVPDSDWKMLMRLVGLEENDIDICERENPGNLREQHHQMLLQWRNRLGREASVFKLMAALHKLGRHADLHNIINNLVAENILGRHAETPN